MVTANVPFEKRLRRIVRRNNRLAQGARLRQTKDGLIVAQPRLYNPKFPLKGLIMLIAVAFLFKGYVYAQLGTQDYAAKVAALAEGSLFEQAGGWLMYADPATVMIGDLFTKIIG